MECKITIKGSFAEIQQALKQLQALTIEDALKRELNISIPEDTFKFSCNLEDDPVTNHDDVPLPSMERIEKVNKRGRKPNKSKQAEKVSGGTLPETHCHTCGAMFSPTRPNMRYCSKRCYMIEWREKNPSGKSTKDAKKVAPDAKKVAPDAKKPAKTTEEASSESRINAQKEKLAKIRSEIKVPQRPSIQRDFQ